MNQLPERKTLRGGYDAYCHVCWQAIYCLWIDDCDPGGLCIEGASKIGDCKQASSWERTKGEILSYLKRSQNDQRIETTTFPNTASPSIGKEPPEATFAGGAFTSHKCGVDK